MGCKASIGKQPTQNTPGQHRPGQSSAGPSSWGQQQLPRKESGPALHKAGSARETVCMQRAAEQSLTLSSNSATLSASKTLAATKKATNMREGIAIDQKDFIAACTTHAVICHVGTMQFQAALLVQGPSTWVSSLRGANIIASLQDNVWMIELTALGTGSGGIAAHASWEKD